jgi:hypothetical protein
MTIRLKQFRDSLLDTSGGVIGFYPREFFMFDNFSAFAVEWRGRVQHEYIQQKLFETGDLLIVEDSPKDGFWGWGPQRDGRNELGKIWMRLRDELRAQT